MLELTRFGILATMYDAIRCYVYATVAEESLQVVASRNFKSDAYNR